MGTDSARGKYSSPDGSRTWEYLSAIFCAIGMTCIGTLLGWNSPSLAELGAPNSRIPVTSGEASTLTASLAAGQMIALPFSVFVADRIGRKNTVLVSALPMGITWGMILVAEDVVVLIVARIIAGFSMGLMICTVPIYMVEILSANTRATLGAMSGITCYGGILFMFAAGPYLGLRGTAAVCLGFTLIFLVCFWCIPESPYFLVMVGRVNEAETALEKLRGKKDVADELELIKATISEKGKPLIKSYENRREIATKKQSAVSLLFTMRGNLRAFLIALTLSTMQHFCGYQTVLYYCHIILKDIGSGINVYEASLTFSILQVCSIFLYALVVDRFGRRPLLFTSGMITVSLLTIIATYFYLMEHMKIDVKQYGMIPLGSIFLLIIALNLGVVTLPGMIMAEIFATDVKLLASCIVGVAGTVEGIFSTKSYLLMATSWGFGHSIPFFGYAVGTLVCIAILFRWLPETKGKTLLEIQKELNA